MATTCRTSDGDLLDTLCHQYYGHLNGSVEAVLDANQGLADEPQPFRAGLLIVLPDLPSQADSSVLLWD
ncbi:phage tail protein X [Pseudomonas protegens]|uniref:tail protein X n=1 Tax=Pseudomonas TaxID=286 RepID=UPI00044258E6|nr:MULTISPECIES: tail protein X [Pseudomonas]MCD9569444.1 tail protein X [Pseudomonas protegens]MCS4261078.1 phage tail protein X [Pseudomonas sp. BIGb0176]ROQ61359.1 phage tail protein X [Pseudomonas protegens]ROQ83677.1 phage tail protein X [Pseudomonas protegens]WRV93713.1 tail protein X [Pseudomonas protegens]